MDLKDRSKPLGLATCTAAEGRQASLNPEPTTPTPKRTLKAPIPDPRLRENNGSHAAGCPISFPRTMLMWLRSEYSSSA